MKSTRSRTITQIMALSLLSMTSAIPIFAEEPSTPRILDKTPTLPFSIKITETVEMPDMKPIYYSDYPSGLTVIDNDLWLIGKNGDGPGVRRMKGKDIENLTNQPGGKAGTGGCRGGKVDNSNINVMMDVTINNPNNHAYRPYFLGGVWYDATENKIYAPIHSEHYWNHWDMQLQNHLATSADLGLTWKYEGPIFLNMFPPFGNNTIPLHTRSAEWSGARGDAGEGTQNLLTDEKSGFHYIFSNNQMFNGGAEHRHHVVRCAISDKMAPGKWRKFYNGKWDEPGVGGKGSFVNAYHVTYNTYLKKYLSFDWGGGVAACDDIEKQEWTPIFKIPDARWGLVDAARYLSWFITNEEKTDGNRTGKVFYIYVGFPYGAKGDCPPLRQRIELGPGETLPTLGYAFSGSCGWRKSECPSANPDRAYSVFPMLDSPDPIESRRTVSPQPSEITYRGEWKNGISDKPDSAVRCTFKAKEIYYRPLAGPNYGKADVYLDDILTKTIDCWSVKNHNIQFGFIKTDLDPTKAHILEIRVRGDKNPLSTGTTIRAGTFEYSADVYQASDCCSSIQGKNQWRYCQKKGTEYVDLTFSDPKTWIGEGACAIGAGQQTPDNNDVARIWTAPQDGTVRIQGHTSGGKDLQVGIWKNTDEVWPMQAPGKNHDVTLSVIKGDQILFIAHRKDGGSGVVTWDPRVIYAEK